MLEVRVKVCISIFVLYIIIGLIVSFIWIPRGQGLLGFIPRAAVVTVFWGILAPAYYYFGMMP
jgi:hypothetical protein